MEAGHEEPSTGWRRQYSLMLGLERILEMEPPKLLDGAELNDHQVDALSGTLAALVTEIEEGPQNGNGNGNGSGSNGSATATAESVSENGAGEDRKSVV